MTRSDFGRSALNTAVALAIGGTGGTLFFLLHSPLPWTLGSLFATAMVTGIGGKWFLPRFAWAFARPFVGVLAGSAFTLPVIMSMPAWWDSILALVVYSGVITLLGWLLFTRVCKYDDVTAFFASAPGGLGELSLLGSTLGGKVRTIVLIHAVRIVVVVFTVPFLVQWLIWPTVLPSGGSAATHASAGLELSDWLVMAACGVAGYFIGRPFRSFGGVMLAPMALSAAVHIGGLTAVSPPYWLVAAVQVVIGAISGARFAGTTWNELRTTAFFAFGWAVIILATALLAAWICTFFSDVPLVALVLAFSPGGIVEVTVMAYAIGLHVAFIVTCQICRTTLVLLITPALFRLARITGRLHGDEMD